MPPKPVTMLSMKKLLMMLNDEKSISMTIPLLLVKVLLVIVNKELSAPMKLSKSALLLVQIQWIIMKELLYAKITPSDSPAVAITTESTMCDAEGRFFHPNYSTTYTSNVVSKNSTMDID